MFIGNAHAAAPSAPRLPTISVAALRSKAALASAALTRAFAATVSPCCEVCKLRLRGGGCECDLERHITQQRITTRFTTPARISSTSLSDRKVQHLTRCIRTDEVVTSLFGNDEDRRGCIVLTTRIDLRAFGDREGCRSTNRNICIGSGVIHRKCPTAQIDLF